MRKAHKLALLMLHKIFIHIHKHIKWNTHKHVWQDNIFWITPIKGNLIHTHTHKLYICVCRIFELACVHILSYCTVHRRRRRSLISHKSRLRQQINQQAHICDSNKISTEIVSVQLRIKTRYFRLFVYLFLYIQTIVFCIYALIWVCNVNKQIKQNMQHNRCDWHTCVKLVKRNSHIKVYGNPKVSSLATHGK